MDWLEAEREYTDEVIGETNLARMFEDAAERHRNRPAQQYKGGTYDRSLAGTALPAAPDGKYHPLSYDEMREVVHSLAAGFRDLGVDSGDRVGIYSNTRMEWAQSDFALLAAGAVITTVYKGSSENQVRYLLGDPGATGAVVENGELLEKVLAVEDDLDLEFVVVIDEFEGYDDRGDVLALGEVYERGAAAFDPDAYESWVESRDLDDLASLIYTSGTTGKPKGVQLTHGNFRANVNQVRKRFGPRPDKGDLPVIDETTRTVSYLPLAHVFERTGGHFLMFASGACVAYAESPDTLRDDFQLVKPTAATSVPRVYERIYEAIREQAESSSVGQRVFPWATEVARNYHDADDPGPLLRAKHAVADRLVFSNVREALGGNIEMLISGGGSLSPDLGKLYLAMGLRMLEGYGLTETSPVVAANPVEDPKIGTVGPPAVDVDVKLDASAAPELAGDDDREVGEVLVKGPNVTGGYWGMPDATDESFTEDGYFRTGDIMERRPDGYLQFRERAKQIIVLSTGKNVAPAPIEAAFASNPFVEQAMVVGDEQKFVGALLVPNFDHVEKWAAQQGIDLPDDPRGICDHDRVHERIQREVDEVNDEFESYERIKQFRLVPEEWTEENDLLTPTMKKKRRNIRNYYEDKIESIYSG